MPFSAPRPSKQALDKQFLSTRTTIPPSIVIPLVWPCRLIPIVLMMPHSVVRRWDSRLTMYRGQTCQVILRCLSPAWLYPFGRRRVRRKKIPDQKIPKELRRPILLKWPRTPTHRPLRSQTDMHSHAQGRGSVLWPAFPLRSPSLVGSGRHPVSCR